jgi:ABC-type lipoprotein release transport system permease subunit
MAPGVWLQSVSAPACLVVAALAILSSLVPTWSATRTDPVQFLKG